MTDMLLAEQIVTQAIDAADIETALTIVMAQFETIAVTRGDVGVVDTIYDVLQYLREMETT